MFSWFRRRDPFDPAALLAPGVRPAFLFGAGISLDNPSHLIDGRRFMEAVLRRMLPDCVAQEHEHLLRCIREPDPGYRPGEYIRFELLMKALRDARIDCDLHVLDCLEESPRPNANHFAAALLLRAGCCVVTTNFDSLIERAWAAMFEEPLQVAVFEHEFPPEGPSEITTLWKIHGSLRRGDEETRASIAATVTAVMAYTTAGRRMEFFRNVLRSRDLVIAGYSGSDDFDLVPLITETESSRSILWIEHESKSAPYFVPRRQIERQWRWIDPIDLCGKSMFYATIVNNPLPAQSARLSIVRGNTTDVIASITAHLGCDPLPAVPRRSQSLNVDQWFDDWARRCKATEAMKCQFVLSCFETWLPIRAPGLRERVSNVIENAADEDLPSRERLNRLIGWLNDGQYMYPLGAKEAARLHTFAGEAAALASFLDAEGMATLRRFQACISYLADGAKEGARQFEAAVAFARENGLPEAELNTLSTWQSYFMAGSAGLNFEESHPEAYIKQRIAVLENETGFFPMRWNQVVWLDPVLDIEEGFDAALSENRRIRRHAVQTGSVFGEALSTLRIALLLWQQRQTEAAHREFLRLSELERVFGRRLEMMLWSIRDPRDRVDFESGARSKRMQRMIRYSIWRGASPVRAERARSEPERVPF